MVNDQCLSALEAMRQKADDRHRPSREEYSYKIEELGAKFPKILSLANRSPHVRQWRDAWIYSGRELDECLGDLVELLVIHGDVLTERLLNSINSKPPSIVITEPKV